MQHIEVYIRAEGRDGYVVGWRPMNGAIATGPGIDLARYIIDVDEDAPMAHRTTYARAQRLRAETHKQGIIDGLRLAGNLISGMVQ